MLSIEEYIRTRKREDNLNEFVIKNRDKLHQYIDDYYNIYLSSFEITNPLRAKDVSKYARSIRKYDTKLHDWLVEIYQTYNNQLTRMIPFVLKRNPYFFLLYSDNDFRNETERVVLELDTKCPYLKKHKGNLEYLIRNIQVIKRGGWIDGSVYVEPSINDQVNQWIIETREKFGVYVDTFAGEHIDYWCNRYLQHDYKNDITIKSYDYRKENNLFNIDSIYEDICNKPFIEGHKRELEALFMYHWLISVDDDDYFTEYWNNVVERK